MECPIHLSMEDEPAIENPFLTLAPSAHGENAILR